MTYLERREPLYFLLVLWIHQMVSIYFSWYHHRCWWNPNLFMRFCSSAASRCCPEVFQGATDRCSWSAAGGSDGEDRVERNELGLSERSAGNPRGGGMERGWLLGENGGDVWQVWKVPSTFESRRFFGGYDLGRYVPFSASTWKKIYHEISHKVGPPR